MDSARRQFVEGLLSLGAVPALAPALGMLPEMAQRGAAPDALAPDPDTVAFWNGFLQSTSIPAAQVPTGRTRTPAEDKETFFFHAFDKETIRPALDLSPADLVPEGDVSVSVSLAGFKPSKKDTASFERLQSANLRIDMLQRFPLVDLLDTMAWTAVAMLTPTKAKKLPPLENLAFDPAAGSKMDNIPLPRGEGKWAINLFAQKADGLFFQIASTLTKEIGRFAPVFSLPGIAMSGLQSFNAFYGAVHTKPEYLFKSNPVPVYATRAALESSATSRRLPLKTGTYVLVPYSDAETLAASLPDMVLNQGYMVPKNLTSSVAVKDVALQELENVTYTTIDVTVKSAQLPCGAKTGK